MKGSNKTGRLLPTQWNTPSRGLAPLGIALFGMLLVMYLWTRCGELLLDFGRELYVFWQMSRGRVLYRDIDYRFGPIPAFANALWMTIFGPGLQTVLIANLLVLAAICAILHALLLEMSDRFSATVATLFFLIVFALGSGVGVVQYNFLTPYNHGATYGFLFCLAALGFVDRYAQTGRLRDAAAAGFFTGLCFLCKPEVFLACATGAGSGLAAATIASRLRIAKPLLATTAAFVAPILVAFLALSRFMSWRTALAGTLGGAQYAGRRQVVQNQFYRQCMGTDRPLKNLFLMLASAGAGAILIGVLALTASLLRNRPIFARRAGECVGGVIAMILCFDQRDDLLIWTNIDRGLPVAMAFAVAVFGVRLLRPVPNQTAGPMVLRFSFAIVSIVLLFKVFFNTHAYHYGFVLATPAAMTAVVILTYEIPRRLESSGASGRFFRLAALGLLIGIAVHRLALTHAILENRTSTASLALGGRLRLPAKDLAAVSILKALGDENLIPPGATLAVFPDAAGLNYASARASSIPFTVFNPFELNMSGEITVLDALKNSPPDYIAIVDTDESEFGKKSFGKDYGMTIKLWIDENYDRLLAAPKPETGNAEFREIILLQRRVFPILQPTVTLSP